MLQNVISQYMLNRPPYPLSDPLQVPEHSSIWSELWFFPAPWMCPVLPWKLVWPTWLRFSRPTSCDGERVASPCSQPSWEDTWEMHNKPDHSMCHTCSSRKCALFVFWCLLFVSLPWRSSAPTRDRNAQEHFFASRSRSSSPIQLSVNMEEVKYHRANVRWSFLYPLLSGTPSSIVLSLDCVSSWDTCEILYKQCR